MVWENKQDNIYRKVPKTSLTQANHHSFQSNSSASLLLFTHIHIIQCHEFNFHFLWNFHILKNFWKQHYNEQLGNNNIVSYTLLIKLEIEGYSQHKALDCDSKEHCSSLVMHWWEKMQLFFPQTKKGLQSESKYACSYTIYASEKGTHLEWILQTGYFIFHNTF